MKDRACRQLPIEGALSIFWIAFTLLLGVPASALAQAPHIAGVGPDFEASAGYAYLNLSIPSAGRVNLNGVDATLTANVTPRFGIRADFSYTHAPQTLSYNKSSSVTSFLGGPVVYLPSTTHYIFYAEALFGGARVDTTAPSSTGALSGYVERFSFAAGGGVQYWFSPRISFRLGADYLQTQFVQSTTSFQRQNNFRATVSIVYHFSSR